MQEKICMRYHISGLVQGVFFRARTQDEAKKLGLTGWVRNLRDGRVEVFACGELKSIAALSEWLKHGPKRAEVENVESKKEAWQSFVDFSITQE